MREILFRGKRIDNGEWVEGFYFNMHHNDKRLHIHHFIIPNNTPIPKERPIGEIQVEVIPETVGQFTGLTDKNGKKIFEGDILARNQISPKYAIKWDNEQQRYCFWDGDYWVAGFNAFITTYEIIGDIHDNPELLEVKE